jgi:uncharacterized repeat protein (TIGR03803 family)
MRIVFVFLGCEILTGCFGAIRSLPPSSAAEHASSIGPPTGYMSIFSFTGAAGAIPYAGLLNVKGTLYGTTSTGGLGGGVVFKITTAGAEKVLYTFKIGGAANSPDAPLTLVNGALYGTTSVGGPANCGSVFRVTLAGAQKTLHYFKNNSDGCTPVAAPLLNVKGILYGTTHNGGAQSDGTVFKITTSGSEKVLYVFKGSRYNDAGSPSAGLTDVKGVLYGTTNGGGPKQEGTVYRVTFSGSEKVLHIFDGSDGNGPVGTLALANGLLYGTTSSGGAKNLGTVFSVNASGAVKVLHSFRGGADGGTPPVGGLIAFKGALYGVTAVGGTHNSGTIFSITTAGKEKVLYSFGGGSTDGANPSGSLTVVGNKLFGTTSGGGLYGKGTVYWIQP